MNDHQKHNPELQVLDIDPDNSSKYKKSSEFEVDTAKECKKRCISRLKIIWSFISFCISAMDVFVIIYLSYLHFSHSQDLLAWLMLLPILLNFIGIFTFLSNEAERKEMESLGCQKSKHLMFFPVVGPTFGALRLFSYAFEEENAEKFERLESLLIKMKQYESYFRAAPEAFVQITFRIVSWSNSAHWHDEDYWTTVCIALCVFTLAESNIYGSVLPAYYRLFNYSSEKDAWKTDNISLVWRIGLFFFNYSSIGSRLLADAIFRATACFYFTNIQFGEVIILTFVAQFIVRAINHAIYQNTFMQCGTAVKRQRSVRDDSAHIKSLHDDEKNAGGGDKSENETKKKTAYIPVQEDLTGVYGAFTYSWRCLFMSFDFQDWSDPIVFFWFYIENVLILTASLGIIYAIDYDLSDKRIYWIYLGGCIVEMLIGILFKYGLIYCWKRKEADKVKETARF